MAQCWNLLAGYAGLISVGQQAFVGLGGYALYRAHHPAGLRSAGGRAAQRGDRCASSRCRSAFVVFRMQGAYFAVVTWVVAEVFRLLLAQWKELGGGTGNSLPRTATSNMLGLEQVTALFDVRSGRGARDHHLLGGADRSSSSSSPWPTGCSARASGSRSAPSATARWRRRASASTSAHKVLGLHLRGVRRRASPARSTSCRQARISPDAGLLGARLDRLRDLHRRHRRHRHHRGADPRRASSSSCCSRRSRASAPGTCIILGALGIAVMLIAPKGLWGTFCGCHRHPSLSRPGGGWCRRRRTKEA